LPYFICEEKNKIKDIEGSMIELDKKSLWLDLLETYIQKHKKSQEFYNRAIKTQVRGGSHNDRLNVPFPIYDSSCQGSKVLDIDGQSYVDFWQGHFTNILGHNPKIIRKAMQDYFQNNGGLVTGFPGQCQCQLAELINKQTGAERIRFTTSGTLASMYSIMLSKAFTQRELVLKIRGGWHGAQPYTLKGITTLNDGMEILESRGLSFNIDSSTITTRFNDPEDLEDKFRLYGDRLACFIIEPFMGAGGFIFGQKEYIHLARDLTERYGVMLIFDEVVSGFRFHAGGIQSLYKVRPDISIFGKTIGGGMPVSAVAGRKDVLELCDPETPTHTKVKFNGGTFSAHPASTYAGLVFLKKLIKDSDNIYNHIGELGKTFRVETEKIFKQYGFNVKCTGLNTDIIPKSSLAAVHFLKKDINQITSPEHVWNNENCDPDIREKIFKLAMINEGFNVSHGCGGISTSHTKNEIQASLDAIERIAQYFLRFKK